MLKLILFIFFPFTILFSQIEDGGSPKFYDSRNIDIEFFLVDSDLEINRQLNPMVFHFGNEYEFNVDVLRESQIILNAEETTFILGIESPNAYGIGVHFERFHLSNNSKLYFYDDSRTFKIGSFNSSNNKPTNSLTTSIVKGDKIILELTVPNDEIDLIDLKISSVIHDFVDIMNYFNTSTSNRDDCNLNVNCSEADEWRDQINGVIRVTMGGGLCSASIVNNTAYDRTPYVLFADHCLSGSPSEYVFHFNYQSPTCSGTAGPLNQSISGSILLANENIETGADVALLELTSNIPDSYDPFYVGWSRSSSPPKKQLVFITLEEQQREFHLQMIMFLQEAQGVITGNFNILMVELSLDHQGLHFLMKIRDRLV